MHPAPLRNPIAVLYSIIKKKDADWNYIKPISVQQVRGGEIEQKVRIDVPIHRIHTCSCTIIHSQCTPDKERKIYACDQMLRVHHKGYYIHSS